MVSSATSSSQQQTSQANLAARQALLTTGVHEFIKVGTFGPFLPGNTARIKLLNIGIMTELYCRVTATADNTGTAAATASPIAPYNLIQRCTFYDYDNVPRIRASGPELQLRASVAQGSLYDVALAGQSGTNGSIVQMPTAVGSNTLSFDMLVPVAIHPEHDLTGAILAQTVAGEQFLEITFNANIAGTGANDSYLYSAGTVSVKNIQVEVFQRIIQPQVAPGSSGVALPQLDLLTVYELNGVQITTSNLSVGQEKLIDYPNNRTILGMYFSYLNDGVFNPNASDLSLVRQIANGSQPLRNYDPIVLLSENRRVLKGDTFPGHYFILSRLVPIYTQLYGNVQVGVTPSSVGAAPTQIQFMTEGLYPKGAVLPAVQSGA